MSPELNETNVWVSIVVAVAFVTVFWIIVDKNMSRSDRRRSERFTRDIQDARKKMKGNTDGFTKSL